MCGICGVECVVIRIMCVWCVYDVCGMMYVCDAWGGMECVCGMYTVCVWCVDDVWYMTCVFVECVWCEWCGVCV